MNQQEWNKLVIDNGGDFLQSWEWGEFQRSLGRRVERVCTSEFSAQVVFRPVGFGRTAGYVPRGPVVISDSIREDFFWSEFEKIWDPATIFFEFDLLSQIPFLEPTSGQTRQPRLTSILDLKRSEDEIFAGFHKNHRYSIRKAQERRFSLKKEDDWEGFYRLLARIAQVEHFRIWPRDYYEKLYTTLAPAGLAEIRGAYEGQKLIAAHLYVLFGGRATHLFGGSLSAAGTRPRGEARPSGAAESAVPLLHWEAIRDFKRRGFSEYDFWGIEPKLPRGLVRFKERFGGERVEYPGSYVRALKPLWYAAYRLARKIL